MEPEGGLVEVIWTTSLTSRIVLTGIAGTVGSDSPHPSSSIGLRPEQRSKTEIGLVTAIMAGDMTYLIEMNRP